MSKEKYPPIGTFYMYACYDDDGNLIGFSRDYEADGAYGNLVEIECNGDWTNIKN